MSGIAGFTGTDKKQELAKHANNIQFHRGPDAQSIWSDNQFSFSHQYISVEPETLLTDYFISKENYVIAFAGEIYNKTDLQKQLGKTNTAEFAEYAGELVLDLFLQKGKDAFSLLEGMYSFLIYNTLSQELILVRDHFGIKPLFYYENEGVFAFSSELKTLLSIPGFNKRLNSKALVSCLNYVWVSGNESMFEAVKKLPPAHYLTYKPGGKAEIHRYWDYSGYNTTLNSKPESEIADVVGNMLEASVKRQMPRNGKPGAFLSGGLDSSLISVITRKYKEDLSTFTISTSEEDKKVEQMADDEYYASYLANEFKIDHNKILIKPDIVKDLPKVVRFLDEPIGDPAAINTYLICKAARERGIKAILSGMGSDELFVGHRTAWASLVSQRFNKLPKPVISLIRAVVNKMPVMIGRRGFRFGRWSKRFMGFVEMPIDVAYMRSYSYYSPEELRTLVTDKHKSAVDDILKEHAYYFYKKENFDDKNRISFTDVNMFMVGLNLTYTDRASMGASVVVRTPFIDKQFSDMVMSLHGDLKLKDRTAKYILKQAAKKIVPEKIINRPKAAFGAPIRSWISNDLKGIVDDLLSKKTVESRGLLNYGFVQKLIEEDRNGIKDNAYQIYQLLTLEYWCREFLDKDHTIKG